MQSINFLLDWRFLIIAVLCVLPGSTLVWTVLVEAVADPLPDVDEVLVGRVHHLVHQLSPLHKVGEHPIQVHLGGTALDVLCAFVCKIRKLSFLPPSLSTPHFCSASAGHTSCA